MASPLDGPISGGGDASGGGGETIGTNPPPSDGLPYGLVNSPTRAGIPIWEPVLPLNGGTLDGALYLAGIEPLVDAEAVSKSYVDAASAKLQDAIDVVAQNLVFIGQMHVPTDTANYTAASGIPAGQLPAPQMSYVGYYVIVAEGGSPPGLSNIPAGDYVRGDWIVCDSTPAWTALQLGRTDVTAAQVAVLPAIGAKTDVQTTLQYLDDTKATAAAVPGAATTVPLMDGVAAAGTGTTFSRADHVHPTDTSRVARIGVSNASEAPVGTIGEYMVVSNTTGVTLPTTVATQICALNLTAGDWEVWGAVDFRPAAGVSPNMVAASVSVHPDALPSDTDLMTGVGILNMITTNALTSGQRQMLMTGQCRSNSAAPLALYLVGQTTLGGTGVLTARGYICARRVR